VYVVKIDPENPDRRIINSAAKAIREGSLVVFPTETVYGIAANLFDKKSVARLYRIKGRPRGKPFTVHVSDIKMIKKMGCAVTKEALRLIKKFWPGPLTIILKVKGGSTMGLRMPANKIALELIRTAAVPVIAPSANLSGKKAPASAQDAIKNLGGKVDIVLDGGRTAIGVESTVIDLTVTPPKILRKGAIKAEDLESCYE
jgi:L-threonylcarbamoyladenylate synthase